MFFYEEVVKNMFQLSSVSLSSLLLCVWLVKVTLVYVLFILSHNDILH